MSSPLIVTLTLTVPPDDGLPADELPFTMTTTFEQKSVQTLKLTGSGTKAADFATVGATGAKFVLVALASAVGAAPVKCRYNDGGASGEKEISPGGFDCLASPVPVAGITELEIVYTSNSTVKIWIFA